MTSDAHFCYICGTSISGSKKPLSPGMEVRKAVRWRAVRLCWRLCLIVQLALLRARRGIGMEWRAGGCNMLCYISEQTG